MDSNQMISAIITAVVIAISGVFALTTDQQTTIIAAGIAIVSAVFAYWQNHQKATVIAAMIPTSAQAANPAVIASLPVETWHMSEAIKRWLTFECPIESKALILDQIQKAEAANVAIYRVYYHGGYYDIEYGALVGDSGNCAKT